MVSRYGLVRLCIVFDDNREGMADQWVEVSKAEADDIADRAVDMPVAGGFHLSGMHMILAIPRGRLDRYRRYVVDRVDELPKTPIMINEGATLVYKGSDEKGDYYEVKPI